jgi:hypothetical protein
MNQYHKIQTVFKRNPETKYKTLLMGEYSLPEFEYLKDINWQFSEKLDGTNIRVMLTEEGVSFGGKTDKTQIPAQLVNHLKDTFTLEMMRDRFDVDTCLYGEGVGAKIQKGGGNYYADQRFVLFDVRVGRWWLTRKAVEGIASDLAIPIAPIMAEGPLSVMIEACQRGFNSEWGDFKAEGLIGRPKVDLFARNGGRVITKLKSRDFVLTRVTPQTTQHPPQ